jgi:hypothetical protein
MGEPFKPQGTVEAIGISIGIREDPAKAGTTEGIPRKTAKPLPAEPTGVFTVE